MFSQVTEVWYKPAKGTKQAAAAPCAAGRSFRQSFVVHGSLEVAPQKMLRKLRGDRTAGMPVLLREA